jgi:hypothetical protein
MRGRDSPKSIHRQKLNSQLASLPLFDKGIPMGKLSAIAIFLPFLIWTLGTQQAGAIDNNKLGEGLGKCNAANDKCWSGCKDAENVDACQNVCAINQKVCTSSVQNAYGGVALKKHN